MIFNLFKSKNNWQHKESNVRIVAVNEELSIDNPADKTLLLSLLNNDNSELVRRAVLLKLNSFDDYLHAKHHNSHKAIQAFSLKQVEEILANNHTISLTVEQKQTFLKAAITNEPMDVSLLSYWLEHEREPLLVIQLFEALVQKKNPAPFFLHVFTQQPSIEVQTKLLSLELTLLTDSNFLSKLTKKAINEEVAQLITDRLASLIAQQEKPKKVLKQSQLLLAKLQALKDLSDYGQYLSKKEALVTQWQQQLPEISCLTSEDQQKLLTKFTNITRQLTQIFAPKEEAYQQAKIAAQLLSDKQAAKDDFSQLINEFNQVITTAVFEDETLEQQACLNKLEHLKEKLKGSVLNTAEQGAFLKQLIQLEQRLTQLPEIAQSVSEATYLISQISQLSLPQTLAELNDRQHTYNQWLGNWDKVNQKASSLLPQSIKDSHKEISQLWREGLQPLQQEQKQLFGQAKKKLIDIKRLLASGKYKVCFGLFKGVSQAFTLLSPTQQQQLQRNFTSVSEKMAEVSDWEHYIATPRKQALLNDINALVTTPLDNPNAQAEKVKHYRKVWNSLGHADEAIDKELNDQFNIACEQAFAPCRQFYAEQDKLREQHLVTRHEILEQAIALAQTIQPTGEVDASIDFKALDGQLNKLQQRWQQAGEVDRQQYQLLLSQFKKALQPVHKAIKDFHDANSVKKQALITQAQQQLALDDIAQAIATTKKLQQQWRDIGFAGNHQETRLWQKFRAINDQVFAKRKEAKSAQQAELTQFTQTITQSLTDIKASIANTTNPADDNHSIIIAKDAAKALLNKVLANKPIVKSVAATIESFIEQLNTQIAQQQAAQEKQSWLNLFALLEKMTQADVSLSADNIANEPEYQQLTSFWKKRVTDLCSLTVNANVDTRNEKTLVIEILAQVESPSELAQQRMQVQVNLMQEQMLSGTNIDLSERLVDWLLLGKLQASDNALLTRLSKVFIKP